ncbi:MAG: DUF3231 family protein [Actinobacteria bacterium]|nr:DUF3231 family protein [Actinomycetota bacterium]
MDSIQDRAGNMRRNHGDAAVVPGGRTRLTSSELANLWASYMESSIKKYMVGYFLGVVEDQEIREVLEYTRGLAQKHLDWLSDLYARENHPIPRAFSDEDINPNTPRLFSDAFVLVYLEELAKERIDGYCTALQMSTRADIRWYFTECAADPAELYNRTVSLMLKKGLYERPPFIPVPQKNVMVKKKSFLAGYLGARRPLTSIEISHIFSGLQRNSFRKAAFTGFSQVAGSDQVKRYMENGKRISSRHIKTLSSLLINNDLPVSMPWDQGVTDSKTSPFSDRIMMEGIMTSNVVMIGAYGKALAVLGLRHDLEVDMVPLMVEILRYAGEGAKILIEKGWFQEPPQAEDWNCRMH